MNLDLTIPNDERYHGIMEQSTEPKVMLVVFRCDNNPIVHGVFDNWECAWKCVDLNRCHFDNIWIQEYYLNHDHQTITDLSLDLTKSDE